MRLFAVLLVRNEADIWPSALAHNLGLFDRLLIVDHQSVDGTLETTRSAIEAGASIDLFHLRYRGYWQDDVSNLMARHAFAAGADWVFFIDADEFLHVSGRHQLESKLFGRRAIRFSWMHLVPTKFGTFTDFDCGQTFLTRETWLRSRLRGMPKVAISKRFAEANPDFRISTGNHGVTKRSGHRAQPLRSGTLLHVPVRSAERYLLKVRLGAEAMDLSHPSSQSNWRKLRNKLGATTKLTEDALRARAIEYQNERSAEPPLKPLALPPPIRPVWSAARKTYDETINANAALDWIEGPPAKWSIDLLTP